MRCTLELFDFFLIFFAGVTDCSLTDCASKVEALAEVEVVEEGLATDVDVAELFELFFLFLFGITYCSSTDCASKVAALAEVEVELVTEVEDGETIGL